MNTFSEYKTQHNIKERDILKSYGVTVCYELINKK